MRSSPAPTRAQKTRQKRSDGRGESRASRVVEGSRSVQAPSAAVSARMSAVRQRHTAPEVAVRRIVHALGVRYRVCSRSLPGRPDLSNQSHAWCIFVHGCFWHGHHCGRGRLPKVNIEFWRPKIERNRARDKEVQKALRATGFRVLTVWQCELDDYARIGLRLAHFLEGSAEKV